ncbi:MAG: site-2 protease family protein [Spirochaetes bacterium]|nr:site-2 protease family protein [Spirochaetota bacterium]
MLNKLKRNWTILRDGFRQTDKVTRRRHVILFALTCLTVFLAGTTFSSQGNGRGQYLDAAIYAVALLAILSSYAFARFIQARSYGVYAGLPFFIPMPVFLPFGTFGVMTRTANVGVNTRALFDIAFWGPVMSFSLSVPCLVLGTYLSDVVPAAPQFENPLLIKVLARVMKDIPMGYDLSMHPLLAAGWVGLFFTAINLFPLGSLSGGQIVYALFGNRQRDIAYMFMAFLFVMALYYPMWFAFVLLFIYLGVEHPELRQARNPLFYDLSQATTRQPLDRRRQYLALLCAVIFAVSFTLRPFEAGFEKGAERMPQPLNPPGELAPSPAPGTPTPAMPSDENSI